MSYTSTYQKHIACIYGYKLVCVHDKFSKPFQTYLGKDAIDHFINNKTEESKYCSEVMKKHFNKELVMTEEHNENFENFTKRLICGNDYINNDAKVKYHCCIKRKYRGFAHRDCDFNVKLNRKILVAKYLNKYGRNRSKQCVREVDLEYPELRELHDDYPLAPDKIEIK